MTSIDVTQLRTRNSGPKAPKKKETKPGGIEVQRYFTRPGVDVYDTCEWELRSALITNERGEVVFEQKDVEMPKFWSQWAWPTGSVSVGGMPTANSSRRSSERATSPAASAPLPKFSE